MASIQKMPNGKYKGRYRDPSGKEWARHFLTKKAAQAWIDEQTASIVTGQYVSPTAGKVTLKEYAETWRSAQVHRPSTAAHTEINLRRHVYPHLGDRPLSTIKPSDVQAWVKRISSDLAPSTVGVIHGIVSGIMRSAVRDRRIVSNPCEGSKLPKVTPKRIKPLRLEAVAALVDSAPERWRAALLLAASTGLRQGEVFGLTVDRVDFLRRSARIDRQMTEVSGQAPCFGPPKTPASVREVPLPQAAVDALAAHLAAFPAGPDGLIFQAPSGGLMRRTAFGRVWEKTRRDALARLAEERAAGLHDATMPDGTSFHDLRHFFASLLIRHGESVKTVQARLGHASAAETLDTYSHLWPDSEDRTRAAVDEVLNGSGTALPGSSAVSLRSARDA